MIDKTPKKIFRDLEEWVVVETLGSELYCIFKEPDIHKTMKRGRLRWAEHVARMSDVDMLKKIKMVTESLHASKQIGGPKLSWIDGVVSIQSGCLLYKTGTIGESL